MFFEQIISIAAMENIYFAIKWNKNMKFYFIWEYLAHFSIQFKLTPTSEGCV